VKSLDYGLWGWRPLALALALSDLNGRRDSTEPAQKTLFLHLYHKTKRIMQSTGHELFLPPLDYEPYLQPEDRVPHLQQPDRAPYPAEWALSRIHPYRTQCQHCLKCSKRDCEPIQGEIGELRRLNLLELCNWSLEEFSDVPQIYRALFQRTKAFTGTVQELATATLKHEPTRWAKAARMIVDYSVVILRSERLGFERLLNSQRGSIYWILDDALLRLCLDRWENAHPLISWDAATAPVTLALSGAREKLPQWIELDVRNMSKLQIDNVGSARNLTNDYFVRTRKFLYQSTKLFEIWRTVRMSGIGRLPAELAEPIIEDVMTYEELPAGDLRSLYLPKSSNSI
jgi:hypothetical protein